MVDPHLLEEAAERLALHFQPERIILFGSHARGDDDVHSDVDLLVIGRFEGDRRRLMVAMDRTLRGLEFARDIVILIPEEFEEDRHIPGTLMNLKEPCFRELHAAVPPGHSHTGEQLAAAGEVSRGAAGGVAGLGAPVKTRGQG